MPTLFDRIKETSTIAGTGPLTLGGAVLGFHPFSTVGDGTQIPYTITDSLGNEEVGYGTYNASLNQVSRDTILSSSNGGLIVTFPAGNKTVWLDVPADYLNSMHTTIGMLGTAAFHPATDFDAAGAAAAALVSANSYTDLGVASAKSYTDSSLAGFTGETNLVTVGTITTGTWHGTKVGLAYGGTNADLSGTGGAANYLKQVTAGAAITVGTIPASDIASGAALTEINDINVTLTLGGTPNSALLVSASITVGWTGTLAVSRGGIGVGTLASNGVLYGNGTGAVQALAVNASATNKFLTQSSSAAPAWNTIASGDLPGSFSGFGNPANPSVNITGSNGVATTAMRSDAVLVLDQTIAPTMTGAWSWTQSSTSVTPVTITTANTPTVAALALNTPAIGVTSTDALVIANSQASRTGAQQMSGRLRFHGQGFASSGTPTNQSCDFIIEVLPVQAATNPTANWNLSSSINGGSYSTLASFTSGGSLILKGNTSSSVTLDVSNGQGWGLSSGNGATYMLMIGENANIGGWTNATFTLSSSIAFGFANGSFGSTAIETKALRNTNSGWNLTTTSQSSVTPGNTLLVQTAAHTAITASTEWNAVVIDAGQTNPPQWATGGLTTQRFTWFRQPQMKFVGASTVTTAVTLDIEGPPVNASGGNATITNPIALRVASGTISCAQNISHGEAFGLLSAVSGSDGTSIGYNSSAAQNTTTLGSGAGGNPTNSVFIGKSTGQASGGNEILIGYNITGLTCSNTTIVGNGASGSFNGCIGLGSSVTLTAANQFVASGITDTYLGGVTSATPSNQTINATGGSGNNIAGANLAVNAGISTGNAVPAYTRHQTGALGGSSGSTAQTLVDRCTIGATKVLTNNSAIALINCTLASNTTVGGLIDYTVEVFDGTNLQVETGCISYDAINKGGAFSGNTALKFGNQQSVTSGTLTVTFAISGANPAVVSCNANSSLTPSAGYPRITYIHKNLTQQAVAIQ